jgi:hypothetical protein
MKGFSPGLFMQHKNPPVDREGHMPKYFQDFGNQSVETNENK